MAAQPPTTTDKSTDAAGPSTANGVQNGEKKLEHLGALEEDDEFEEFPAEDWPESSTTLAALTSATAGTGQAQAQDPSAQLWEDNWDDDDKESPFTQQLRAELQTNNDPDAMKM
ncbi:hypothetical protein NliqN6_6332 [Naganishia liquefaciens]|uniref:26S proteasome complex subunit SEM1 n=1 Tax=Naganishia liquefaciens TaxID=104408 RepID=A0A8H3TZ81_9TREE|nr:hypothetical protein NliqN6_6332 [Naganishia liquefaciens]